MKTRGKRPKGRFVICLRNTGFRASLEPRKVYRCVGSARAGARSMLRVIDESGQAYLYPKSLFAPVRVPSAAQRVLALAG
ncbi:MAG TPA: hypothetical protein VE820_11795 [Sphingomicrobium sp.]|jgi:hypothetical protein|nr:hypothetical protein [Sphingomicrobium sp.]